MDQLWRHGQHELCIVRTLLGVLRGMLHVSYLPLDNRCSWAESMTWLASGSCQIESMHALESCELILHENCSHLHDSFRHDPVQL